MRHVSLPSRRAILVGSAGAALAYGCGDSGGGTGGSGAGGAPGNDLSDVIYEGGASDEALLALLAVAPTADAAQGTRFLTPEAGATLPASSPALFSWAVGTTALRPSGAPGTRHATRRTAWVERAIGLALGVRTAHAHGAPVDGRAYLLVIGGPDAPDLVRVFTTLLTYTPSSEVWSRLTAQAGELTASITSAVFEQNRLAEGAGPFSGADVTFRVGA